MERTVQIFKALGDETRVKILLMLSKRKICAKGISKHLDISEAAVSQHIKILKEAGIIAGEKTGYYVLYNLQQSVLSELINFINEIKDDKTLANCKLDTHLPLECAAACKANRNKCCKKNEN